ncbi:TauD/TfdA dioxygenase family protein [Sphingobium sp. B2]|uniref:Alpha-ketoglutarate-dependent dioxygenase n=1 Tax=Sphingobium sp. B2 TaxID=2583228 RepID=A0A5P9NRN0_9SPHN|nr:TauD/TfdA family dioxygenase [Sphingobium sp. B2]QFU78392.1 alpha-ketoglutarate-dependent dioxygenase [Sphingobium sp. B2]
MPFQVNQLHPIFAAEMFGCDILKPVTDETRNAVEDAMAKYAVLVIRDQAAASDEDQVRFAKAFGPLELPPDLGMSERTRPTRVHPKLYDVSNLDENGNLDKPDTLRRKFAKGNELFHTDSSFNDLPTKWSMLLAHVVTPTGGNTEFVDTRAAYDALSPSMKEQVEPLSVIHSLTYSRERGGLTGTTVFDRAFPPVTQPLVRTSASGRKALYIGAHAATVVGMDEAAGRTLLDKLISDASRPEYIYSHKWLPGDLVIWDNRCTMHRATEYAYMEDRRDLRRATINEFGEDRVGARPI